VGEYTDDQMMSEFDRFFQNQPGICDFVAELTSESTSEIQELSLFLAYMVFKAAEAAERDASGSLKEVSAEQIGIPPSMKVILDRTNRAGTGRTEFPGPDDSEPFLVQYVISELQPASRRRNAPGRRTKGEVFFCAENSHFIIARKPNGKEIKS
jgi:hypothetical protein